MKACNYSLKEMYLTSDYYTYLQERIKTGDKHKSV